jgi:predicted dehydrogenase
MHKGFLESIEKESAPPIREEVAYHTLKGVLSAYQSAKKKRVVTL